MTKARRLNRRQTLKGVAAAALPLVHIRTAGAAGKLSFAMWDHWVPEGNAAFQKAADAWAAKNKVDVKVDFLSSNGEKINIAMAAEAQATRGHNIYAFDQWTVHQWSDKLVPMDDVVDALIKQYGPVAKSNEYLGKIGGHWMAVPTSVGSAPLTICGRISRLKRHAGIDVTAWYPAHETKPSHAAEWTYATQLRAAEACHKAGVPFALGCGATTDSIQTWGATFAAFGADLVDGKGNVIVDSDPVRSVLEYARKLLPFMPPDTVSYDNASNNRALISGKSALIWNPPSAWAVAKRDAPKIAEDCWTFSNPGGPKGRIVPMRPYFWGIWKFAQNQSAGKDLLHHLMQQEHLEAMDDAAIGYDIPLFVSMSDFRVWAEVEPPKGTIYNYPLRPWHGGNTTYPDRPRRRRSRCRCGTARSSPGWSRNYSPAKRSTSRSPGRGKNWKGSYDERSDEERTMMRLSRRAVLTAAAAAAAAKPRPAKAAGVVNVWWTQGFYEAENKAVIDAMAAWEKETGNKVNLTIIVGADLIAKLIAGMQFQDVPDLVHTVTGDRFLVPQASWNDQLVDVSDVLDSQKAELHPTAVANSRFYNKVLKKYSYYAVPLKCSTLMEQAWRPLIQEAGFSDADIPKTQDAFHDFFQIVQDKLRSKGKRICGLGYSMATKEADSGTLFHAFLAAYGGVGIVTPDGKLGIDNPVVQKAAMTALDRLTTPYKKGYVPPGAINWGDVDNNNAFYARQIVMTPNATISISVA